MKRNNGFTLIELLVVILITGFVFGIASLSFSNFMDRVRANDYAEKLKVMIETAKGYSFIKGVEGFDVSYRLYGVRITSDKFELFEYFDSDSVTDPANVCINIADDELNILEEIDVKNANVVKTDGNPFPGTTVIFNKRGFRCGTTAGFTAVVKSGSHERSIVFNTIGGINVN